MKGQFNGNGRTNHGQQNEVGELGDRYFMVLGPFLCLGFRLPMFTSLPKAGHSLGKVLAIRWQEKKTTRCSLSPWRVHICSFRVALEMSTNGTVF